MHLSSACTNYILQNIALSNTATCRISPLLRLRAKASGLLPFTAPAQGDRTRTFRHARSDAAPVAAPQQVQCAKTARETVPAQPLKGAHCMEPLSRRSAARFRSVSEIGSQIGNVLIA